MISVTVLTKNNQNTIHEVLQALKSFNEVVVYDTGSVDQTLEIAKQFPNVTIHQGPLIGFGPTHNQASNAAKNDWILYIDSDEVVSEEMVDTLTKLELDPETVYAFPSHNYYNGKWIRWCGWYPNHHVRLYNRTRTRYNDAQVHEAIMTEGMQAIYLNVPVRHYSYHSISDFLKKMQLYSDLFVEQHKGKKRSSPLIALGHALGAFFKSYFVKRGFMGGYEGFLISTYNANTAFYKYLKLYEANQKLGHTSKKS